MSGYAPRAHELLAMELSDAGRLNFQQGRQVVVTTASALHAIEAALSAPLSWRPIAEAPQDDTRLLLWDSETRRPVFGSWRGDNPAITHYAAEPAGPEVAQ
ncbi:hypothetical protein [Stenotrophomonas sp. S4]